MSDANSTSGLVASYTVGNTTYAYTYDRVGNITQIDENGDVRRLYTYDTMGQLIREYVYPAIGSVQQYQYSYDKSGNITNVQYNSGSTTQNKPYTYGNTSWGDLLTNYNGTSISYDAIGNPLKWRNATAIEWSGRQLSLFAHADGNVTYYTYSADGIRTKKTVYDTGGSVVGRTNYTLDGNKIVAESRNGTNLYYLYDDTGAIMGISYGYDTYTFAKNIQGDVIGIYSGGTLVAKYEYNAYGQILSITNSAGNDISGNASHIANLNPFRYRGYYYDTETGFYYVFSRYYDPEIGRWVNADSVNILANQFVGGYNSFSFSLNNFVNTPNVMSAKRSAFVQGEYSPTEPDIAIIYNVPLYDQNGYNLCWAFCQVMVDDFVAGISRTNEEATQSAIALAMERHRVTDINDVDAWNKGSRPLNLGKM